MNRTRWSIAALGVLATICALWPITSLFMSDEWFTQAIAVVVFVALVGVAMRALVRSRLAVPLVQLVATTYVVLLRFGGETFSYLLPTTETMELVATLGADALETIQKYVAPAPLNTAVTFCLVAAAGLVAIAVDATAATWRSPAAAGLPLLTAYLIAAANGTDALTPVYFMTPVLVWLIMLHTTSRGRFGRWSTTTAHDLDDLEEGGHDRGALRSFSSGAVRLGMIAVLAAVVIPSLVPHFPPRYLTEGLGRSAGSGDSRTVGFNDTVDLTQSLLSTDQSPVIRYTSTGFGRVPLRAVTASYYSNGKWTAARPQGLGPDEPVPIPPPSARKDYTLTVSWNNLRAPQVAAPYPVVGVFSMDGVKWETDPVTRDILAEETPRSYRLTYADIAPTAAALRQSGEPTSPDILPDDLSLPDRSAELLRSWADEVTGDAATNLDKAIAIQDHLRDTSVYTYNLDLGPPPRDEAGRVLEPIRAFYQTRRGFCAQFASAMILMARAEGIPARMAIGFLPGTRSGNEFVIRQSDAHAWPELYFEDYGWLRFEPTPSARSGSPPPYAVVGSGDITGGGSEVTEDESTATSTTRATRPDIEREGGSSTETSTGSWRDLVSTRAVATLTALVIGLLAVFLMPLSAWLVGLRRRRAARDRQELIEVEWDELTSHLHDLGLDPPPGGTLRQWRQHFITSGHLDHDNAEAMGRVTATLERARYARPERTSPEQAAALHRDIRSIRRQVSRTRALGTRARSFLWPSTGVAFWRRVLGSPRLRRRTDHGRSITRPSSRRDPGGAGPVARDGVGSEDR